MSKQELLDLIHQSVCDSFTLNQSETIETFNSLLEALNSSQNKQSETFNRALFNYTMNISETSCIAMSKVLIAAGILNISEADD